MNIKEHIEAGHYPKDEKGRALVPMRDGHIATITATYMPGHKPIIGWFTVDKNANEYIWLPDGCGNWSDFSLLPPPPRKVKITRWALMKPPVSGYDCRGTYGNQTEAECAALTHRCVVVELTGEAEEPWS